MCKKLVDPRKGLSGTPPRGGQVNVSVKEYEHENGDIFCYERYEAVIPVGGIERETSKIGCQACHKYGKNLACPPHSPYFDEYVGDASQAMVICIRMPQDYFKDQIQENGDRRCFRTARAILVEDLLRYRTRGYLVAGSGFCLACEVCAVEEASDKCVMPNKRIYSLESLGVNLVKLLKECLGLDLEWSATDHAADFVCAVGAVFTNDPKGVS